MKFIHYLLLSIFFLGNSWLSAQTASEVLTEMTQAMANLKNIRVSVIGTIETNEGSSKVQETFEAEIIQAGKRYYYSYFETEIVVMDSIMLTIDNESKMIVVDRFDPKIWEYPSEMTGNQLSALNDQFATLVDSSKLQMKQISKGFLLEQLNPGAAIEKTQIAVAKGTFLPIHYAYDYNPKLSNGYSRLLADYKFKPVQATYSSKKLQLITYLNRQKNNWQPSKNYTQYRVVNRY